MLRYDIRTGVKKIKTKAFLMLSGTVIGISGLIMAVVMPVGAHAFQKTELNPTACGNGKQVVNVTYNLTNDYDSAVNTDHAWANDTINRHLQIWQSGNSFCAEVSDNGSFVTFAGPSPNDPDLQITAGIKGIINGGYRTLNFTGSLVSGRYSAHGFIGSYNVCTNTDENAYDCSGTRPSYLSFVNPTSSTDLAWWGWHYHTAQNGDMSQSYPGDFPGDYPGNITN